MKRDFEGMRVEILELLLGVKKKSSFLFAILIMVLSIASSFYVKDNI